MTGDILFYSHLGSIPETIYEGKIVQQGDVMGTINTTGVPEK